MSTPVHGRLADAEAARVAGAAARQHGIKAPIELLRAGANHVFRAGDAVVRVAPSTADVSGQIALARWLSTEGFSVAAPLGDAAVVEGAQVSLWEYVPADVRRPVDYEQLGDVVARLHRVPPSRVQDLVALRFCGDAAWLAIDRRLVQA